MAKFVTTSGVSHYIEDIIISAQHKLCLISPYLQLSTILSERLKEVSERGVKIEVIYGKSKLNTKEEEFLENLSHLSLYYLENLHAKCYFNESLTVITSMNLYEFSEKTNREMGILVHQLDDTQLYQQTLTECQSIIKAAQPRQPITNKKQPKDKQVINKKQSKNKYITVEQEAGCCIRCGTNILFNPEKPYCKKCFLTWSQQINGFNHPQPLLGKEGRRSGIWGSKSLLISD